MILPEIFLLYLHPQGLVMSSIVLMDLMEGATNVLVGWSGNMLQYHPNNGMTNADMSTLYSEYPRGFGRHGIMKMIS